jgi:uncharacterized membrane protein HdeD (DUF308 family)
MSLFKRLKELLIALVTVIFGILLIFAGEEGQLIVVCIICLFLFFEGIYLLIYYMRMARHMVGGKRILISSILTLDLGLLTLQMISMNTTILIYLLSIFAFTGVIDILRSIEAKHYGGHWKVKFINGCIYIIISVALIIAGVFVNDSYFLVCCFSISLIYSAFIRILSAFRKTTIVYIQ